MKDQIKSLFQTDAFGHGRGFVDIDEVHLHMYYRVTRHFIDGVFTKTFDVAAVEIQREHRGQGNFRKFLEILETIADEEGRVVYVESVQTTRFADFFLNNGYLLCNPSLGKNFYRPIGGLYGDQTETH